VLFLLPENPERRNTRSLYFTKEKTPNSDREIKLGIRKNNGEYQL